MWQNIISYTILALAVFYFLYYIISSVIKSKKGKNPCSSCSAKSECNFVKHKDE